jgi:hypothetical protein
MSDKRYDALRVLQKVALTFSRMGAHVGLFIVGAQGTYYIASYAPNHLPSE